MKEMSWRKAVADKSCGDPRAYRLIQARIDKTSSRSADYVKSLCSTSEFGLKMASAEPRFRVLVNASPFPFLFSLRTILTIIVGMLALSVQAQEIYTGAIAISPSQRTNSWRPTNTLAPGDSANL